jgi:hypothetical protein
VLLTPTLRYHTSLAIAPKIPNLTGHGCCLFQKSVKAQYMVVLGSLKVRVSPICVRSVRCITLKKCKWKRGMKIFGARKDVLLVGSKAELGVLCSAESHNCFSP